ncbi:MAG: CPBP family intramembrane glutamic endopeptidase [Promethearchaeia archaeon]
MNNKNHYLKLTLVVLLVLPILFGINRRYLFIIQITPFIILMAIFGVLLLIGLGKLIITYGFNQKSMEIMKKHEVIKAFTQKNFRVIFLWFPITILMEELIFRYYITGFLASVFDLLRAISLAGLIFGFYHIHIWFFSENKKITLIFILFSLILGIVLNFILYYLGILFCITMHYFLVTWIYYKLYKRYLQ